MIVGCSSCNDWQDDGQDGTGMCTECGIKFYTWKRRIAVASKDEREIKRCDEMLKLCGYDKRIKELSKNL